MNALRSILCRIHAKWMENLENVEASHAYLSLFTEWIVEKRTSDGNWAAYDMIDWESPSILFHLKRVIFALLLNIFQLSGETDEWADTQVNA